MHINVIGSFKEKKFMATKIPRTNVLNRLYKSGE